MARRVLIIGSPGSGKSTLARILAARTGLPLVHLDREFWQPGWVPTDQETWRERVAELVAGREWIVEGNFSGSLDLRLARAEVVVRLDPPRLHCLRRVLSRSLRGRGVVRPDMAPGCPERIDLSFYRWVWNFRREEAPAIDRALAAHPHVRVIRSRARRVDRPPPVR